jgi:coatomer subunit beta
VDKFKPDGSLKDEFILVCNNFRKDLLHPNEYVVGRALRLVSSIHNKFIQESLIESVVDKCLVHIDMYVRRSAVVCLARVLEYFGPDFLPDIVDKLEGSLEKETDLTTKRNIFLLFIKLDRDRAINYLLTRIKEEDHEGFGDILQLIILKTVQEAMIKDRKVTGTCLKIIKEFANSKFSSVLYEVASALIRYNRSPESLRTAVGILIQVLKNNNDNNVKLLILEQLDIVRRRDRVVLIDCFIDLVTLLFSGDLEIKQRFLPFMEGFIRKENVGVLQKILVEELKLCLNDKTIEREYQTRVVLLFNRLVTQGILTVKIFLSTVLPVILHASPLEHSTFEVVRIALQNIFQHISNADKKSFLEVLKQSLQEIKDIRICGYVITLLSQHVQAEEEVKGIMSLLLQSVGDLPLKRRESKQDSTPTEVKEEKKFIRKTVIKPDGTYGDELVEVTDDNKAELTPEEVVYYKIRDFCMDSEDFCLSLARGFSRLLSKLKPDEQDVKIVQGSILLLLCEFLKYFQGKNFESTDRSTIKQITACLKMIANKKFVQNGRFIFDEVLTMDVPSVESQVSVLSTNVPQDLEQSNQQEGKSMIGEFTVFRQLKGAKAKQLDLETADIADIAINEDDNAEEDYSTKLSRLVQLTGSSVIYFYQRTIYTSRLL